MIPHDFSNGLSRIERIAAHVRREKERAFCAGVLAGLALMLFLNLWAEAGSP